VPTALRKMANASLATRSPRLSYRMQHPWRDGTTHVVMEPSTQFSQEGTAFFLEYRPSSMRFLLRLFIAAAAAAVIVFGLVWGEAKFRAARESQILEANSRVYMDINIWDERGHGPRRLDTTTRAVALRFLDRNGEFLAEAGSVDPSGVVRPVHPNDYEPDARVGNETLKHLR